MSATLCIVQPYIPKYRYAFFQRLHRVLEDSGVRLVVLAGAPSGAQSARSDSMTADWHVSVAMREVRIGQRTLKFGSAASVWDDCDAIIVGAAGTSMDTYQALYGRGRSSRRVGVWGHIAPYVNRGNWLDLRLELAQMRRAHEVFAYTVGGQSYAVNRGISEAKITTVMNSIDTHELESAVASTQDPAAMRLLERIPGEPRAIYSYCGGLDTSKRIDFLAATLDRLWLRDKGVKVLVAGDGADRHLLKDAEERGQVVMLGYADAETKALMSRLSLGFLNPGRIGLLAVDALVLRRPILTTDYLFHAPEAEYLTEQQSVFTSRNMVDDYAELVLMHSESAGAVTHPAWSYPTLDQMVANFASGVLRMMQIAPNRTTADDGIELQ